MKKRHALSTAMFAVRSSLFKTSMHICWYVYIYIYIYALNTMWLPWEIIIEKQTRASFFFQKRQRTCVENLLIEQQCARDIITRSKHVRDFNKQKESGVDKFRMFKFATEHIGVNHIQDARCVWRFPDVCPRMEFIVQTCVSHRLWRDTHVCVCTSILMVWNEPATACE